MIDWQDYAHNSPPKDGEYLVSDGTNVEIATVQTVDFGRNKPETELFLPERTNINGADSVTHYAEINTPIDQAIAQNGCDLHD